MTAHDFQLFGIFAQRFHTSFVRERYGKYSYHISEQHHDPDAPMKRTEYRSVPNCQKLDFSLVFLSINGRKIHFFTPGGEGGGTYRIMIHYCLYREQNLIFPTVPKHRY